MMNLLHVHLDYEKDLKSLQIIVIFNDSHKNADPHYFTFSVHN